MNVKKKLTWAVAFAAVVVVLPMVWTLAQAQTGDGRGSQAPGSDTEATAAEASRFTNDVPRTPPSPAHVEEQLSATAKGSAFQVLPASAFSSDGDIPTGFHIDSNHGYLFGLVDLGACVVAPVHLPDGVTISSFEVRLKDANIDSFEWFSLHRTDLETGTTIEIATVSSPSGYSWGLVALVDDTFTSPVVSNMYTYSALTCARSCVYVYSVRIAHSSRGYRPVVGNSFGWVTRLWPRWAGDDWRKFRRSARLPRQSQAPWSQSCGTGAVEV